MGLKTKYFLVQDYRSAGKTITMFDSIEELKEDCAEYHDGYMVYEATEVGKVKFKKEVEIVK